MPRRPGAPIPTVLELRTAAQQIISTLSQLGCTACFIGGMACSLYGVKRPVEDLDVFVLTSEWEAEILKTLIVSRNSSFYLIASKTPGATYKKLYYRVPSPPSPPLIQSSSTTNKKKKKTPDKSVKIDILLPGAMDLPSLPTTQIIQLAFPGTINGVTYTYPVAPLRLIIMTKLQAWSQRRESGEERYLAKVPRDHSDIAWLLGVALRTKTRVLRERPSSNDSDNRFAKRIRPADAWLTKEFVDVTKRRVLEHVAVHPGCAWLWKVAGFRGFEVTRSGPGGAGGGGTSLHG